MRRLLRIMSAHRCSSHDQNAVLRKNIIQQESAPGTNWIEAGMQFTVDCWLAVLNAGMTLPME